jgi:hypothetical protein
VPAAEAACDAGLAEIPPAPQVSFHCLAAPDHVRRTARAPKALASSLALWMTPPCPCPHRRLRPANRRDPGLARAAWNRRGSKASRSLPLGLWSCGAQQIKQPGNRATLKPRLQVVPVSCHLVLLGKRSLGVSASGSLGDSLYRSLGDMATRFLVFKSTLLNKTLGSHLHGFLGQLGPSRAW